jgi:hypothetical protein
MKHMVLAVLLAVVLTGTARAGEVPSTGAPAPKAMSSVETTCEIPATEGATPEEATTIATFLLTLLDIVT